jgi:hypothetical protein
MEGGPFGCGSAALCLCVRLLSNARQMRRHRVRDFFQPALRISAFC